MNQLTEYQIRNRIKDGTISWHHISEYQTLSEDFIREYADNVTWEYISAYQILSESFLREFADKVYWSWITVDQSLSEAFVIEMQLKGLIE